MKRMASLLLVVFLLTGQATFALAQEAKDADAGATAFSIRLFQEALNTNDKNVVISPVSAYLALSMAAAGAGGDTLHEFGVVLGVETDTLAAYCASLSDQFMKTQGSTIIRIANSGWVDESFQIDPKYLDRIKSVMNAEAFVMDLDTNMTREAVNDWVKEKTSGLIPMLLNQNLSEDAVLALINTLYFKARWRDPFEANDTFERAFHRMDGSDVNVPFMNEWRSDRDYIHVDGVEGILRPYDDGKTALIALRATDGRSARALAGSLKADTWLKYIASARETYMNLSIPKFTLDFNMTMNDVLKAMGLKKAFDPELAEFADMGKSTDGNIFLSEVYQKVRIGVNEEGTEAAAATIVGMLSGSAMPIVEPVELIMDSPFVYAVVELDTGIPLFIGCMDDPAL